MHGNCPLAEHVVRVVEALRRGLVADYVPLGGGNVKRIEELPPDCRRGESADVYEGGFRLRTESRWDTD